MSQNPSFEFLPSLANFGMGHTSAVEGLQKLAEPFGSFAKGPLHNFPIIEIPSAVIQIGRDLERAAAPLRPTMEIMHRVSAPFVPLAATLENLRPLAGLFARKEI